MAQVVGHGVLFEIECALAAHDFYRTVTDYLEQHRMSTSVRYSCININGMIYRCQWHGLCCIPSSLASLSNRLCHPDFVESAVLPALRGIFDAQKDQSGHCPVLHCE